MLPAPHYSTYKLLVVWCGYVSVQCSGVVSFFVAGADGAGLMWAGRLVGRFRILGSVLVSFSLLGGGVLGFEVWGWMDGWWAGLDDHVYKILFVTGGLGCYDSRLLYLEGRQALARSGFDLHRQ
ncbi:hypothetical protein QBC41DRAFT_319394 [Cercophora samala]|uniref:Uncharacterized protein n=1 Tax=Cercophora samala TaxID=330535 RepID=A0AA39ZFJ9_9PEZI|nr:hypothetical protein QBC41DRAFT_319394 [Cercophora samala]